MATKRETYEAAKQAADEALCVFHAAEAAFDTCTCDECERVGSCALLAVERDALEALEAAEAARDDALFALIDSGEPQYYTLRFEGGETLRVGPFSLGSARAAALNAALDGSYGDHESTLWVDVVILDESGARVDSVTVTIEPTAPKCSRVMHEWRAPHSIVGGLRENPGVIGNGGGVIVTEVCMHCGCARITNTWAQRPDTGEQGLTSVRYEDGKYADEVRALRRAREAS